MAVDVTAFTALARQEFMEGMIAAHERITPAAYDPFVSNIPSTVRVETHTFMSNIPRLKKFKGYSGGTRLTSTPYTVVNDEYRMGPVTVRQTDLDDDQIGGYMKQINSMPAAAQRDIGFKILDKLADGTVDLCFDGSAMFANSHTIGSGDNLLTANNASNDAVTHYIIALVTTNPVIKPMIFQERESLGSLDTDADTPQARKLKEYEYWCDCRFGLAYGYWWDAIHVTITDTPTLAELNTQVRNIINGFRGFTLPKGDDQDDALYAHEGWVPDSNNLVLLCNMALAELLQTLATSELIASGTSGATVTNEYKNKFSVVPTSALGA